MELAVYTLMHLNCFLTILGFVGRPFTNHLDFFLVKLRTRNGPYSNVLTLMSFRLDEVLFSYLNEVAMLCLSYFISHWYVTLGAFLLARLVVSP